MLPHLIATTVLILIVVFSYFIGRGIKEPEGWLDVVLGTFLGGLVLLLLIGGAGILVYVYHLILDSFVVL
ncbi:hypothetical protein VPMG_00050 [Vibrio phage VBP32]|uniref:Uncharacterized protein n=2 Tax=Stoningtonvirus VBP47 TaxID=2846606 RepID=M4SL78_9CAUD|nr:hypothetical protein VPNG_00078 [Vibrio phage VBP47]YP_007676540.1 hypothetical protein VPMG_00050 [Vibrio phage VBP32]AGH57102.1 hypothetical protein VPNG_00078 [Vibrio phage VBP47]AGH57189.1 hypothetical protein VPMG_00050 [Vibrio phage VBP32]